ncbi:MAG: hypothetical protein NDI61_02420 [Bdellovibrionaceae bacterium]|nr:hypothetical protein [Pseudobdellovibrionaceae bacterium]
MTSMIRVLSLISAFMFAGAAHAQDAVSTANESATQSKAKLPSQQPKDIDEEITNARLRASTGAKKRFSLQSAFNYNGGSIQSPLAKERPQLTPGSVYTDPSKLTGSISGKFRMTDYDNINVGIGVGWLTPMYEGQRGQAENPYVSYSRVFKAGRFQNVLSASASKYTADRALAAQLNFSAGVDYTVLTSFSTGTDFGAAVSVSRNVYDAGGGGIQDFYGIYPFMEQALSEKLSLRTVYRGFEYYNQTSDRGVFSHDDPTQSLGLGISVARDLYLYPNVQWVWEDMRSDKTNVAISANINL